MFQEMANMLNHFSLKEERRQAKQAEAEQARLAKKAEAEKARLAQQEKLHKEALQHQQLAQAAAAAAQQQKRADRERKKLLESIPLPSLMQEGTDLEEFLTTLETALKKKEMIKELWALTLVPKLPTSLRTVILNLQPEEQAEYPVITKALREHVDTGTQTPRHSFFNDHKAKGTAIRDHRSHLQRLLYRCTLSDEVQTGETRGSSTKY